MAGYLKVTETATTLNIKTDAAPFFEIEFDEAKGGVIDVFYTGDGGSTNYADATNGLFAHFLNDGSDRPQGSASAEVMTVIENTPIRVIVHFTMTLTTNVTLEQWVSIIPHGYLFFHTKVTNSTGASITGEAGGVRINTDATNYASDTEIADNGSDATPTYNTEYWFGQYASGLNSVVCGIVNASTQAQQDTYASAANTNEYHNVTPAFATATSYTHTSVLYIGGTSATEANLQADIDDKIDLVMAAPTTGSEVTDLVIPLDLSSDGFAADGARHSEMASEVLAYTADTTRLGHVDVIHDPMITTNGSTDLVVGHWKCDDNAATTALIDETGNSSCTLAGGDNTEDKDNADAVQGTSLLLNGTDDYLNLSDAISDLTSTSQFTVQITAKPNFAYNVGAYHSLMCFGSGSNDRYSFLYYYNDDVFWLYNDIANAGESHALPTAYTSNIQLQQFFTVEIALDLTNDFLAISWNGVIVYTSAITETWSSAPIFFNVGTDRLTSVNPGAYYIDNVKLIDGCLLPYGAYFTGNGAVDTDVAHEDITFLWQGADATPIGTDVTNDGGDYATAGPIGTQAFDNSDAGDNASAATSGNISAAEGSLSFWFKPNSALGADCTLFYADAAFKVWWDDSDNDVVFTYNTDVLNMTTAFAAGDTNWHHVCCQWKASDSLYIIVDGLETSLLTGVDAAPTLDATMYFTADDADGTNRADVLISDFFITDKLGSPQIPVVLGSGPIYAPIQEIS